MKRKLGYDERICPKCGEIATAHFVHNGVSSLQVSPFWCEDCGWIEGDGDDE